MQGKIPFAPSYQYIKKEPIEPFIEIGGQDNE